MKEYDHTTNAGNRADIWKHKLLLNVIKELNPKTYFETHCGYPFYDKNGSTYYSSYMQVATHCACRITVCDINKEVSNNIPPNNGIKFLHVNGWEQIHISAEHDLYFIDPPYYNTMQDFLLAQEILDNEKFKKPIIIWYPIYKDVWSTLQLYGWPTETCFFMEGELRGCGMIFKNM